MLHVMGRKQVGRSEDGSKPRAIPGAELAWKGASGAAASGPASRTRLLTHLISAFKRSSTVAPPLRPGISGKSIPHGLDWPWTDFEEHDAALPLEGVTECGERDTRRTS